MRPLPSGLAVQPVGLGRRMLDRRGLVALLDDVVGRGEALLDVAEADAAAVVALVDEVVGAVLLEGRRRHRLLDVEDGGQVLVVDHDAAGAFERGLRGVSASTAQICSPMNSTRSSGSTGSSSGPTPISLRIVYQLLRHVLVGQHAHDARHLQRRRRCRAADQRVMPGRAHHLRGAACRGSSRPRRTACGR